MELISIGFLLGIVFSIVVFGSGVILGEKYNRHDSTEQRDDNSRNSDIPFRYRYRSGDNRHDKQQGERR